MKPRFPIGIPDIDTLILQYVNRKTINNLLVNKYIVSILQNQNFWKQRLYLKHGLISPCDLNYKMIGRFLENGKSLNENYMEANKKGCSDVLKILKHNEKISRLKFYLIPKEIDFYTLKTYSNKPYEQFISAIIQSLNYEFSEDFFNQLASDNRATIITIPFNSKNGTTSIIFHNDIPFTVGTLLHAVAKKLDLIRIVGESKVIKW